MKHKREKLLCDIVVSDNMKFINQIGKIANSDDVLAVVYPETIRQLLNSGVYPDRVSEKAQEVLFTHKNIAGMTSLLAINNYYYGGRQIYKIDDTLSELLAEQAKQDLCISVEVLQQLPVPHFFVMRKIPNDPESVGFFFTYVENMVYISDISSKSYNLESFSLRIEDGKTIPEIIEESLKEECGDLFQDDKAIEELDKLCKKYIEYFQYIIYLSAVNSDISPITKGAIIKRQAGKRTYTPRDKSEISEVGYKVGSTIRKVKESSQKIVYVGESGKGSPKSPHLRRSHFHSYWVGSGDNKELVVKWVNAVFVHGNTENKEKSTMHNIK